MDAHYFRLATVSADHHAHQYSRVHQAMRLGVHELLVTPISPKTLKQRLTGILLKPRPMVRAGKYYIPLPRRRVGLSELLGDAPPSQELAAAQEPSAGQELAAG